MGRRKTESAEYGKKFQRTRKMQTINSSEPVDLEFLGQRYERFGSGEKTNIKIDTCINHQAVVMLQLAKNYFEEVAIEAN